MIVTNLISIAIFATFATAAIVPPWREDVASVEINTVEGSYSQNLVENRVSNYRLPKHLVPIAYTLEIQPLIDESDIIYGERFTAPANINIDFRCVTSTNKIELHANGLDIYSSSIRVTNLENSEALISVVRTFNSTTDQTYTIELEPALRAGSNYNVYIEYVAPIPNTRTDGLYRTTYKDYDGKFKNVVATDFEADDARRAWPLFDEPALKATWQLKIIRKSTYHSLSNTPLESSQALDEKPGWYRDTYKRTVPLPSYLVAMAVSDYTSSTAHPSYFDGRPVSIWGPPPQVEIGGADYAANTSARMLEYLESYIGYDANLEKMDKISLKDFSAGAMENLGLNTYRESRLMYFENHSTIDDKSRMTTTLSHEIAHQWFGNTVTNKWWNDIWLNEGFATYFAAIGVDGVHPEFRALDSIVYNTVQFSMQADVQKTTRALSFNVSTEAEISAMFDTITYYKGASILRMVNSFLGNSTFIIGLQNYLEELKFSNAEQDDLFRILGQQAINDSVNLPVNVTFKAIMDTWTTQSGFPVVYVGETRNGNNYSLRQEQFSANISSAPIQPASSPWYIPITYQEKGASITRETKIWMTDNLEVPEAVKLESSDSWVIVNPEQLGFYRVIYTKTLYDRLVSQLGDGAEGYKNITTLSRSALIDDSLNIAYAGYPDVSIFAAMNITLYMNRETEFIPWVTLFTNLAMPYRMFGRSINFNDFKKYLLQIIMPPLTSIGMDPTPEDDPLRTLLRTRLMEWACNLGESSCIAHAQSKFKDWMTKPEANEIFPDLRPTIYCTAIANGGDSEWDFLIEQYKAADVNVASEYLPDAARINIIRALGCAKQTYKLAALLDYALDLRSFILPTHKLIAMQAAGGNSAGVELTFNFIRNNFATILRRYGASAISGTITTLSTYLNTELDKKDVESFLDIHTEISSNTALDNIEKNINWMENIFPEFVSWLETAEPFPIPPPPPPPERENY